MDAIEQACEAVNALFRDVEEQYIFEGPEDATAIVDWAGLQAQILRIVREIQVTHGD